MGVTWRNKHLLALPHESGQSQQECKMGVGNETQIKEPTLPPATEKKYNKRGQRHPDGFKHPTVCVKERSVSVSSFLLRKPCGCVSCVMLITSTALQMHVHC